MNYTYKCSKCKENYDVFIGTSDIMDSQGRIDQEKLGMRISEPRVCECSGKLEKQIVNVGDALWFESGIGKGKISRRFV